MAEKERRRQRLLLLAGVAVVAVIIASLVAVLVILYRDNKDLQDEVKAFEVRQARVETIAAGEVDFMRFGEVLAANEIFATATKIAKLNAWDKQNPVIDEAYKAQYDVEMVQVPAGCFWMGSVTGDSDERPVHEVCFDAPFWIDRFEVTNAQFERLGGEIVLEDSWSRPDQPRAYIKWFEAQQFCEQRNAQLPTEAMWEYAARGSDSLVYPWGNEFIEGNVVYVYNSNHEPADVGEGQRREGISWVGAYDMSGNIWEWVADWYDNDYYAAFEGEVAVNQQGPEDGGIRVLRGGGFDNFDSFLRGASRDYATPELGSESGGFRCARLILVY